MASQSLGLAVLLPNIQHSDVLDCLWSFLPGGDFSFVVGSPAKPENHVDTPAGYFDCAALEVKPHTLPCAHTDLSEQGGQGFAKTPAPACCLAAFPD